MIYTLPKTNIATENGCLENEMFYCEGLFPGVLLVSRRVDNMMI